MNGSTTPRTGTLRTLSTIVIALGFCVAGLLHFTHTAGLAAITPLPFATEIVWITGIMEFLFAGFLLWKPTRQTAALWLSLFCILVLAANINMAINNLPMFGSQAPPVVLWGRIPAQFFLIAWILYAADAWRPLRTKGWRALLG
ncbi:MAG: hypothetical protein GY887_10595 [Halieaceae bacterium]|nr:hypothetical protein [Halieaceae bacterium]